MTISVMVAHALVTKTTFFVYLLIPFYHLNNHVFVKWQTAEIIVRNNRTGHDIELVADPSLKERVSTDYILIK